MCSVQVPPKEDALLVNVGDYVSMMTRGRFSSPLHRVVSRMGVGVGGEYACASCVCVGACTRERACVGG